jgi:hypothetical protein
MAATALTGCSEGDESTDSTVPVEYLSPIASALDECQSIDPENYERFGVVITDTFVSFTDPLMTTELPDWLFETALNQEPDAASSEKPVITMADCVHEVVTLLPQVIQEKIKHSTFASGTISDTSEGLEVTWSAGSGGLGVVVELAGS